MGSIGNHKNYLRQGNFSNLDEFDEEVLNDNNLQDDYKSQSRDSVNLTQTNINTLQRQVNSVETIQEAESMEKKIRNTLDTATNYRKELQNMLVQLRKLQRELRRS